MKRRHAAQLAFALALAAGAPLVVAPSASFAELCRGFMPQHVVDVRGYTFTGTVVRSVHPQPRPEFGPTTYTFHVDHVFATKDDPVTDPSGLVLKEGGTVSLYGESCDGIRHLAVGSRYLFSTSYLSSPTGPETAAWRISGDRVHLVRMFPGQVASPLAQAATLKSALALASPGSDLPPTDVRPTLAGPDPAIDLALMLVAATAGAAFGWSRRSRLTH